MLARSADGVGWTEQRISAAGSNPNWEVRSSARSPFFGDYNYVSAVGSTVRAVWTDTRDLVPGSDPRETGADDDADGFDGFQTCTWVPNDIDAPRTTRRRSPTPAFPRALSTRTSTSRRRERNAPAASPPASYRAVARLRSGIAAPFASLAHRY